MHTQKMRKDIFSTSRIFPASHPSYLSNVIHPAFYE